MKWTDTIRIAEELNDKFPDVDPLTVRFTDLQEGMTVEVIRGPLAGLRGVLQRKGSRARLVIGVTLIRQAASVELDALDVVPVS